MLITSIVPLTRGENPLMNFVSHQLDFYLYSTNLFFVVKGNICCPSSLLVSCLSEANFASLMSCMRDFVMDKCFLEKLLI